LRGFVVKAMELGAEAATLEKAKDGFVGCFDGRFLAIGYGFCMDGIAVVVIQDEDVVVATGGGDDKATGLIRANLASDGLAVGVDVVGAMIGWLMKSGLGRGYNSGKPTWDGSIGCGIKGWLEQLGGSKI
jgi:hypothetical protein